ncbi:MAG: DUF3987 domain-containing protein, partial [Crocosphaera sp.]
VYFVVNGGGHKDGDVTAGRAIFCEHDHLDKDIQRDLWKTLGLTEPTFQIDTGGKSIHSYWVFVEAIAVEKWRELQKDLLEYVDGDRSIKNPSRVMRLAGCWHISFKSEEGNGHSVAQYNQSSIISDSGCTYTYSQLRNLIPSSVNSTSSYSETVTAHQSTVKSDQKTANGQANGKKPTSTDNCSLLTEKVPLYQFLTLDDRNLIDVGAANGTRNSSGAKLARNLIGTSIRLNYLGIPFTEDPYQLFIDYCNRCPSGKGWNEREWLGIWKSAESNNPTASLTDEALINCAKAWQKKSETPSVPTGYFTNGHSNRAKPAPTNNGHSNGQLPPLTTNGQGKNNVVNHPRYNPDPIDHDKLMARIEQLIGDNLGETQVSIELTNLAKEFGVFLPDLKKIYNDHLKQLEQIEDREDTKKQVDYFLKAEHTDIDLRECLPQEMADPLTWIADVLGSNPLSMLTILLSVVASLTNPDTKLELIKSTGFYAKPILYTGIVAESGSAKSPTMKTIISPFKKLQNEADVRYKEQLEKYEEDMRAWKATKKNDRGEEPIEPAPPREYFTNDATAEAISLIQSNQPDKGLLMEFDELSGLIKSANAYRGGKGTDAEKILSGRDGTGIKVNRASGKRLSNPRSTFSITGGIQRDVLKQQMGDRKDSQGHWARFLWAVMPIKEAKFPDDEPPIYINTILEDLYRKIEALPAIDYKLSPEARTIYAQCFRGLERKKMNEPNQALRAAYAKMKQFVGDIALLLATIENAFYSELESDVSKRIMVMARYLGSVYLKQIKLIYGEADTDNGNLSPIFKKIIELSNRKGKITARDTIWGVWDLKKAKASTDTVRGYFNELVEMGYGSTIGNGRRLAFISNQYKSVEECGGSVEEVSTVSKSPVTHINTTFEPLGAEKCGGSVWSSVEEVWRTEIPTNTDPETKNGKSVEDLEQKTQPIEKTSSHPSLPNEKTESIKTPSTSPTVIHTFDETLIDRGLQSVDEDSTLSPHSSTSSTLSKKSLKIGSTVKIHWAGSMRDGEIGTVLSIDDSGWATVRLHKKSLRQDLQIAYAPITKPSEQEYYLELIE